MTKSNKQYLLSLLNEYYDELTKTCDYDCYNCKMGILETYGSDFSCALDFVTNNVESELYR